MCDFALKVYPQGIHLRSRSGQVSGVADYTDTTPCAATAKVQAHGKHRWRTHNSPAPRAFRKQQAVYFVLSANASACLMISRSNRSPVACQLKAVEQAS